MQDTIVLISLNRERMPSPVIPIGLGYIGAELLHSGFRVRMVDLALADGLSPQGMAELVAEYSPVAVGLSMRNIDSVSHPNVSWYLPAIGDYVSVLKEVVEAPIFIGGSGFTLCAEGVLRYLDLELGLAGEGESQVVRLVRGVLLGNAPPEELPGAVYRAADGSYRSVPPLTAARSSGALPGPGPLCGAARDLLEIPRYLEAGASFNIQTKRGCPLQCTYCVYPLLEGRRFRLREPASVVDEMESGLDTYGAQTFTFVDNIFNLPPEHAKSICRELIHRKLNISWEAYLHPSGIDEELLSLMIDSGIAGLEFTPDAGSYAMLQQYQKGLTLKDLERTANLCHRYEVPFCFYFLFGGPGETWSTVDETFALADRLDPTAVVATLGVRVLPRTGIHRSALANGMVGTDDDLLAPTYYIAPAVSDNFEEGILERVRTRPNWIIPGLGVNYSAGLFELARRFGKDGPHWRHVKRLTSSHIDPVRGKPPDSL